MVEKLTSLEVPIFVPGSGPKAGPVSDGPPPRLKSRRARVGSTCAWGQAVRCPSRQHRASTGPALPHHPFLSECLRQCPHLFLSKASVLIKIQELEKCSMD